MFCHPLLVHDLRARLKMLPLNRPVERRDMRYWKNERYSGRGRDLRLPGLCERSAELRSAQKEREMDESISLSTAKNAEAHFSAGASRSGHAPM
jgi:hypothetical protein